MMGRMFKLPPAETYDISVERDLKIPMPDGVNLVPVAPVERCPRS
ncbi:MAG: hypothetical protein WCD89_23720 [Anaerocolumna sp.]